MAYLKRSFVALLAMESLAGLLVRVKINEGGGVLKRNSFRIRAHECSEVSARPSGRTFHAGDGDDEGMLSCRDIEVQSASIHSDNAFPV